MLLSAQLKVFTFDELNIATGNFRADSLLGMGSSGSTYKGWIDGNTLAVKKFNQGYVDHKEWLVSSHAYWICL